MRRFKELNQRVREIKQIKRIAKEFNATNFRVGDGYFIFDMGRKSVVHFDLPNRYKVGIWLTTKQMFAEHLGNIDKFKPSASDVSEEYSLDKLRDFLSYVITLNNIEADEWYSEEEEIKEQLREIEFEIGNKLNKIGQIYYNDGYRYETSAPEEKIEEVFKEIGVYLKQNLWEKDLYYDIYLSKYKDFMNSYYVKIYINNEWYDVDMEWLTEDRIVRELD